MDPFLQLGGPIFCGSLGILLGLRLDLFFHIRLFGLCHLDQASHLSHLCRIDPPFQLFPDQADLLDPYRFSPVFLAFLSFLSFLVFRLSLVFLPFLADRDGNLPPCVPCGLYVPYVPFSPFCPCCPCACAIFYASSPRIVILTSFSSRFGSDYGSVYLVTRQMKYIENFVNLKQNDVVMYLTYHLYASSSSFAHYHDAMNPPFDSPLTSPKWGMKLP